MSIYENQHPFYITTNEERQEIRRELGLKESTIEEDIDSIMEWFQKQPHLVGGGINREFVENMLIAAKGSMEKTKRRIDNLYKYRGMSSDILANREKILSESEDLWKFFVQMSIPRLYKGNRIGILKLIDSDPSQFSMEILFRNTFMLCDLRLRYDYFLSEIWIVDFKYSSLAHLLRINPLTMQRAALMFQEGLGIRVHSIHIVNATGAFQHIISFFKQFLTPKIFERLTVHSSIEELHKHIPKKYLPKDYGGDEPSMAEFKDKYEKEIRNTRSKQVLIEAAKMVSDESKRPDANINDEFLAGSFRKLDFD
ncbi:hypothetical protein K1T71_011328 [Dendrolimus kikuchii]|uniref:Uncharacterized protein n=1 Tax=Dendrolimus kikuchii TaxID=765133 RepID=A0ACC1CNV6_9NEOP|nr:hypothetical protein K1T71_011328 [Dendrolimus kikuchii]